MISGAVPFREWMSVPGAPPALEAVGVRNPSPREGERGAAGGGEGESGGASNPSPPEVNPPEPSVV